MARRRRRTEAENQDRWLVSYADFITLMFAFFVVMYSVAIGSEGAYKQFSDSISMALTKKPLSDATSVVSNPEAQRLKAMVDRRTARLGEEQRKIQERMKGMATNLGQVMSPMVDKGLVNIKQTPRGVVIDISASTLFNTGEATLQPGTLDVLHQVAQVLSKEELPIEVEGHTDDIPIATAQFPSNWELSSGRASSVVRLMIDNGVPAERLSVVGLASNQPLVPNDSPENRAKNRRVTITIVAPKVDLTGAAEYAASGVAAGDTVSAVAKP